MEVLSKTCAVVVTVHVLLNNHGNCCSYKFSALLMLCVHVHFVSLRLVEFLVQNCTVFLVLTKNNCSIWGGSRVE